MADGKDAAAQEQPKFATQESLQTLVEETGVIETSAGAFKVKKISVYEFLEMKKDAVVAGETDEWLATKLLMAAAIVQPVIDEDLLARLPIGLLKELTKGISAFAGVGEDFTEGQQTE